MSNKQIIETLKNIKFYCLKNEECSNCVFHYSIGESNMCRIETLIARLYRTPENWDIEIIEDILNEDR